MPDYDQLETIESVVKKELDNVHTTLVGRVETVNGTTIDVLPVTKKVVNGCIIDMPVFKSVPPVFIQGGSSYDAMPITKGDYCLLIITEDCTDHWYNGADGLEPNEDRRFDYSDCFALVGLNPLGSAITIPTVATIQGDRIANGNWTRTGNTTQTGDVGITGDTTQTGDIILNGISLFDFITTHTHSGVTVGAGNTGGPNPL